MISALLLSVGMAVAQDNLVQNGDFANDWDNWTTNVTNGSEDVTYEASLGLSKTGGNDKTQCVNGGSAWKDDSKTKSWTITLSQELSTDLEAGRKYAFSYQALRNRAAITATAVLTDGAGHDIQLGTMDKTGWNVYSGDIDVTVSGTYTLLFTFSTSEATDKQHYFRLDNVSLLQYSEERLYPLTTSTEESPVYCYLAFLGTDYVVTGAESGEQALVRTFTGSEAQQWALIGNSASSFKLKNRATGLYLSAAQKMVENAEGGEDYKAVEKDTSYEFQLGSNNAKGLNPNSGIFSTRLSNWNAGDVNNRLVPIAVSEPLYSLADAADIEGASDELQLTRTFKAGWNTLCMPFNLNKAQLWTLFGDDVELYEFTSEADGALTFTRVNLSKYDNSKGNLRDNTAVTTAGVPYLMHTSADVVNPAFLQTSIKAETAGSVVKGNVTFSGTYTELTSAGKYGVTAAGGIRAGKDGKTLKAWSAYLTTSSDVRLQILADGVATGIETIDRESPTANPHYDLSGRRVQKPVKGLYIVDGKKVLY